MQLLRALAYREARSLLRSTRGWAATLSYLAAGSAPALAIAVHGGQRPFLVGGGTVAAETFALLPWLAAVYAFFVAVDAVEDDRTAGAWYSLLVPSVSNVGYLLRRAVALASLLLPVVAAPAVVAYAVAWKLVGGPPSPSPFLFPLGLQVVPVVASFTALGMGAGLLGRGFLGGTVIAVAALTGADAATSRILDRPLPARSAFLSWLGTTQARWLLQRLLSFFDGRRKLFPLPASDTPWQAGPAMAQLVVAALPVFWVGWIVLAASGFFLGRTRRSPRPWKLTASRELRTLGRVVERLRIAYSPDAYLGWADGLLLAAVLLLHGAGLGAVGLRSAEFHRIAAAMAAARSDIRATTPKGIQFEQFELGGSIEADGRVATEADAELVNRGPGPVSELAFALDRNVRLTTVRAADGRRLTARRHGGRLLLTLGEPLPADERLRLRFALEGRPVRYALNLPGWLGAESSKWHATGFERAFRRLARIHGTLDLSSSYVIPALSARRTVFELSDLAPLPRYSAWGPGEAVEELDPAGGTALRESYRPRTELRVDLTVPTDLLLADSCGDWTPGPDGRSETGRLAGGCTIVLSDFAIAGGHDRPLVDGGVRLAGLPAHAETLRVHAAGLAEVARALARAWPGRPRAGSLVFLEWPEPTVHNLMSYAMRSWEGVHEKPRLLGRLVLVPESELISRRPVAFGRQLVEPLARSIAGRRPASEGEAWVFERLVAELLERSLGRPPGSGAVVPPFRGGPSGIDRPLAAVGIGNSSYWHLRFPAIVAALSEALGPDRLRHIVEGYLRDVDGGPARVSELLDRLEAAAEPGGPLAELIDRDLRQGGIAHLALARGEAERVGDGWRVSGEVINTGSAPAVCPVEVVSDSGSRAVELRVAAGGRKSFALTVSWRPSAILLDRLEVCHRYRSIASRERIDL